MSDTDALPAKIKQLIKAQVPSAIVYLYGSRAKGTAHSGSDWDVLVLLKEEEITPEIEESITYPLYDLEFDTGQVISPMVYTNHEWHSKYSSTPFYRNVMREGTLL